MKGGSRLLPALTPFPLLPLLRLTPGPVALVQSTFPRRLPLRGVGHGVVVIVVPVTLNGAVRLSSSSFDRFLRRVGRD